MGKGKKAVSVLLVGCMTAAMLLAGCGDSNSSGKTEIEIIQYKMEATDYFDALEEEFNATHDDIHLTIDSPNDASTIMRTRFIRKAWRPFRQKEPLSLPIWPMRQVFFITRTCLRSTAGRFLLPGMN